MSDSQLSLLVDVKNALSEDVDTAYSERLERDRRIGRELAANLSPADRLLAWWRAATDPARPTIGERVVRLRRMVSAVLCLIGALLGMSLSTIVFSYDGAYPVNLFALLGVVVGIPLVLLILTLVLLPGWIPGLGVINDAFSGISPSRWVGVWLDRYSQLNLFSTYSDRRRRSSFARWQLIVFSQWLAVGFFLGVLLVAWLLVVVTDLAFGWSTTLQADSAVVYSALSTLASPWSAWLPVAVPDLELVEASRFYRLEADGLSSARAVQLGEWWPFVLMVIVVYGLLPRVALLLVGFWRLRLATCSLLVADPDTAALLDRLALPVVGYAGDASEEESVGSRAVASPPSVDAGETTQAIVWNDAVESAAAIGWLSTHQGVQSAQPIHLSVLQDLAERTAKLQAIDKAVRRVVIFTKGWEPPLLEFSDCVELIRENVAADVSLMVVPLDVSGVKVLSAARKIWAQALTNVDDARLYVVESQQ